jgi:hypothetical protein
MAVCSVPELAAKFLCFTSDNGRSMAGVSALRQALSIEEAPPGISRFVLGVLEVLTLSTGGLGCACLLGLVAPQICAQPKSEGEGRLPTFVPPSSHLLSGQPPMAATGP